MTGQTGPSSTNRPHTQSVWGVRLAVLVALGLQVALPGRLILLKPYWLMPALEAALLAALLATHPYRDNFEARTLRAASIALVALVNLANLTELGRLVQELLKGKAVTNGRELIYSAVPIWLTLILIFALWYWEFDRGGPMRRGRPHQPAIDLRFPQDEDPDRYPGWVPTFVDYLYVSLTNSTAFSPTDTMPLTPWAKSVFGVQCLASLLTVGLVFARAVNILS